MYYNYSYRETTRIGKQRKIRLFSTCHIFVVLSIAHSPTTSITTQTPSAALRPTDHCFLQTQSRQGLSIIWHLFIPRWLNPFSVRLPLRSSQAGLNVVPSPCCFTYLCVKEPLGAIKYKKYKTLQGIVTDLGLE